MSMVISDLNSDIKQHIHANLESMEAKTNSLDRGIIYQQHSLDRGIIYQQHSLDRGIIYQQQCRK